MYFENAWYFVYAIFVAIQGNSVGFLFNGLLAELPAILDTVDDERLAWLKFGKTA